MHKTFRLSAEAWALSDCTGKQLVTGLDRLPFFIETGSDRLPFFIETDLEDPSVATVYFLA